MRRFIRSMPVAFFGVLVVAVFSLLSAGSANAQLTAVTASPSNPSTQHEIVLQATGMWHDCCWREDSSKVTVNDNQILQEIWSSEHRLCCQAVTFLTAADTVGPLDQGEYSALMIEYHDGWYTSYVDTLSISVTVRYPALIHVPADQPTIQAGIDAASEGDTVLVTSGTYAGDGNRDIDFGGKEIVLQSENGPEFTVINAGGTTTEPHRAFIFRNGEDSSAVIEGFTITGGVASAGAGAWCKSSSPTFVNCVFVDNHSGISGGAVRCKSSSPHFLNCTFVKCSAPVGGMVFCIAGASPRFEHCIMAFGEEGGSIECADDTNDPQLVCTNVYGNDGGDWIGCIADQTDIDGNFSSDPEFCDTAAGDYYLSALSPCAPANNDCGELIGALGVGCELTEQLVYLDIKPGSCPNPFNVKGRHDRGKSVLPAAILGTEQFDIREIDPTSLTLAGVPPVRWSYEDVATPAEESDTACACSEGGPDGFEDLTLKFSRAAIIDVLPELYGDDDIALTLTGKLSDGTDIEASDCITIRPKDHAETSPFSLEGTPEKVVLVGNHPNPFNPATVISFGLPEGTRVKLDILNILGQEIVTLLDEYRPAGYHTIQWDAGNMASGVYLYRLHVDEVVRTKKMIVLR